MKVVRPIAWRGVKVTSNVVVMVWFTTLTLAGIGEAPAMTTRASVASADVGSASPTSAALTARTGQRERRDSRRITSAYEGRDHPNGAGPIVVADVRRFLRTIVCRSDTATRDVRAFDADLLWNQAPTHKPTEGGATEAVTEETFEGRGQDQGKQDPACVTPSDAEPHNGRGTAEAEPHGLGESLGRSGNGLLPRGQTRRRHAHGELTEWRDLRTGCDSCGESVGKRNEEPGGVRRESDDRHGENAARHRSRRGIVDRIRKREELLHPQML